MSIMWITLMMRTREQSEQGAICELSLYLFLSDYSSISLLQLEPQGNGSKRITDTAIHGSPLVGLYKFNKWPNQFAKLVNPEGQQ